MSERTLDIWVIYDHPEDYPDKFVARCWEGETPTDRIFTADTVKEIRELIPPDLYRLDRDPSDDPVVLEVWI